MTLLTGCNGWLRGLALAAVCMSLVSCATVQTQSPLDYIGPAHGAAIRPVAGVASVASQPAAATVPAGEAAAAPPTTTAPAEAPLPAWPASRPAQGAPATLPGEPVQAPASQPLSVSITEAVLISLEHNQGLVVQRFSPQLRRTAVEAERARFDPDLSGQLSANQRKGRSPGDEPHKTSQSLSRSLGGQIAVDEFLPTGTSISVEGDTGVSYPGTDAFDEFYASRIGVNVTQSLLRGFGLNVNLASLQQAQIDVQISQYDLRGYAQDLVATVQETYWDYALAAQQIAIVTQSLEVAKQQLNDVAERVAVGSVAETELAAPQAQVALREGNLINARSALMTTRLRLIQLLNSDAPDMWDRDIVLQTMPSVPEVDLGTPEEHVQVAMRMRPDLNQARLQLQKNELTVVRTKNGLLPQLDLFVNVGRTGYAESFAGSTHGRDGLGYDVQFGGRFEFPPLNRAARAAYTASVLNRSQQLEAIRNLEQLAQVDVRTAYVEVGRTREQITATAATRQAQQETLRAETEKFRVGKSTSLLVALAQSALLDAQIAEVRAVVGYLRALTELYRLDGTLLVRMGIQAPGSEPVILAAK